MKNTDIEEIPSNRVLYSKTLDRKNMVILSDFIIVNNDKITCGLNIKNGDIQPTLKLKTNKALENYVIGMRSSIPNQMRYTVTPTDIYIDLISDSFTSINGIENESSDNIIQFNKVLSDNQEEDAVLFNSHLNSEYKKIHIENFKIQEKMAHEERLYINFKTGYLFSIINSEYRCLYLYCEDLENGKICNLVSKKDIGAISRLMKFWPELGINIFSNQNETAVQLKSIEMKNLFNEYIPNSVYYIYNYKKTNTIQTKIQFVKVSE